MPLTSPARSDRSFRLPDLAELLVSGGDARLELDSVHGLNKYGCPATPDAGLLAFGSSTASAISPEAFAAVAQMHDRIERRLIIESAPQVYASVLQRMRQELLTLCVGNAGQGAELIFAGSGTDLHRIAGRLCSSGHDGFPVASMAMTVEVSETGSGVPAALQDCGLELLEISVRAADSSVRSCEEIDAEVEQHVGAAVADGRGVLVVQADVSKSGMIAPSPACVLRLHERYGDACRVLVDGCQLRLAPATVRAYLQAGIPVMLTGSKFMGGPVFSGAMLVPSGLARSMRRIALPGGSLPNSLRAEWPEGWEAAGPLPDAANFGLLLRWEAALHEMRAFYAVEEARVARFLRAFAAMVAERVRQSPLIEPLQQPVPDRRPLAEDGWDVIPSIFPLLFRHADGRWLSRAETRQIYRRLQADLSDRDAFRSNADERRLAAIRGQLGQPVACGERDGVEVSALRLCVGARMVAEAERPNGAKKVLDQAGLLLAKAEWLVFRMRDLA